VGRDDPTFGVVLLLIVLLVLGLILAGEGDRGPHR
jgi:hypothetical protein